MTDLRTAALRALKALKVAQDHWNTYHGLSSVTIDEAADMLREALAQPEDKSQAAFEHWVETVEATQKQSIIQPEIKADKEARWLPMPWKGLTEEEHNYYKALGFVGVKAVEEKLRAKNSTLVSK
jgi:hypothetical protein